MACNRVINGAMDTITTVKKKRCPGCGIEKPLDPGFHIDSHSPDGHQGKCKTCRNRRSVETSKGSGIDSWAQMESVLRRMAELQGAIDAERVLCKRRVAMVKQYSQEGTELWRIALRRWRRRIRAFVSKQCGKGKCQKKYRFGSIRYKRGKLSIELDSELAAASKDKP